jgi:hypothetical protein
MTEHDGQRSPELAPAALAERVRLLEGRLAAVADAVSVLAHGLEDLPMAKPGGRSTAEAARRAHDLLLLAEPPAGTAGGT